MVMLNQGGNYIKTSEAKDGEIITFKDEGKWQESRFTYDDGNPKDDFVIKVMYKNEEKSLRLNKKNRTTISDAYGDDTSKWLGKTAEITKKIIEVGGVDRDCIRLKINKTDQTTNQGGGVDQTDDIPF